MSIYLVVAEHVRPSEMGSIKKFCKEKKIRVTKIAMDETFTNLVRVRVSGDTKRVANKVRDFIWDNINNGAYCDVKKV